MESLKKNYPSTVTQGRSLPYDAMLEQLIEWQTVLVYMRDKIERGEDLDECEELMSAIDNAVDKMTTRLAC